MSKTTTTTNNSKKRKHSSSSSSSSSSSTLLTLQERIENEKQILYNKLVHQCTKDITKQIKIAKAFECQKLIRRIKVDNDNTNDTDNDNNNNKVDDDDDDDDNHSSNISNNNNNSNANTKNVDKIKMERKLSTIKNLSIDTIVQECFRRLGLQQLNPSYFKMQSTNETTTTNSINDDIDNGIDNNNDSNIMTEPVEVNSTTSNKIISLSSLSKDEMLFHERIVRHKKIQLAIEKWNDKITDYRRWCLRQDERLNDESRKDQMKLKLKLKQKDGKSKIISKNNTSSDATSTKHGTKKRDISDYDKLQQSLFVNLGTNDTNDGGNGDNYYGPAGAVGPIKNRPGQRARRAKAMALEAKKEGRKIDQSINWRQPKQHQQDDDQKYQYQQQRTSNNNNDNSESTKSANNVQLQNSHPSWQAASQQQRGIVQYEGSRIKFNDDSNHHTVAMERKEPSKVPLHNNTNATTSTSRKESTANQDELHPSWQAARKSTTIVPFQGKKITF